MKTISQHCTQRQNFLLKRTKDLLVIFALVSLFLLPACSSCQVAGNLLTAEKQGFSDSEKIINPQENSLKMDEADPEWPGDGFEEEQLNPDSEAEEILKDLFVPEGCDVKLNLEFEKMILELINEGRSEKGLQPLVLNEKLQKAARQHSVDMACENYFNHIDLEGNSFDVRVQNEGYQFAAIGENIYAGENRYNCPEQAFKGWYRSQRHYQVMFHSMVTEIGIGYAYNPESRYGGYFTADFAKPTAEGEN